MTESKLEFLFAYYLSLFAADLGAEATREYAFNAPHTRHRFDFCWIRERVAAEIDGGVWLRGGGRHNADSDRHKLNLAASQGWLVLRFSGRMVENDPAGCIDMLRRALTYARQQQKTPAPEQWL